VLHTEKENSDEANNMVIIIIIKMQSNNHISPKTTNDIDNLGYTKLPN